MVRILPILLLILPVNGFAKSNFKQVLPPQIDCTTQVSNPHNSHHNPLILKKEIYFLELVVVSVFPIRYFLPIRYVEVATITFEAGVCKLKERN